MDVISLILDAGKVVGQFVEVGIDAVIDVHRYALRKVLRDHCLTDSARDRSTASAMESSGRFVSRFCKCSRMFCFAESTMSL